MKYKYTIKDTIKICRQNNYHNTVTGVKYQNIKQNKALNHYSFIITVLLLKYNHDSVTLKTLIESLVSDSTTLPIVTTLLPVLYVKK